MIFFKNTGKSVCFSGDFLGSTDFSNHTEELRKYILAKRKKTGKSILAKRSKTGKTFETAAKHSKSVWQNDRKPSKNLITEGGYLRINLRGGVKILNSVQFVRYGSDHSKK